MADSQFSEGGEREEDTQSQKFCPSCGNEMDVETKFCADCGTAQDEGQKSEVSVNKKENTKITFSKVLAYFFGGSGLVLGLLFLATGPASAGFFLAIAGLIGFPKSRKQIEEKLGIELSKWIATALFLVFWMIGAALL